MKMSKMALMAALFGAAYSPPSFVHEQQPKAVHSATVRSSSYRRRSNTGTGKIGNRRLHKDIQQIIIDTAKIKRQRKAYIKFMHGMKRDANYYRVLPNFNNNRFVPMNCLEEINHG